MAPKYNVLMLGWEFYPVFAGGMGVVTSEIVQGLVNQNIGVHFVIPRLPTKIEVPRVNFISAEEYTANPQTISKYKETKSHLKKTYVDTKIIPYSSSRIESEESIFYNALSSDEETVSHNHTPGRKYKSIYHNEMMRDIKMFEDKTAQIAMESDFQLIHAHDWVTFRAAIKAKAVSGKPVVLHVHATEMDRSGDNPDVVKFDIEKECLLQADFVVTVSEKSKADIIQHYKVSPDKIYVIHNSTNFQQQHQRSILAKKDKLVLFLGRITMQKGPEYFIYAANKVLRYLPDTIFLMTGDGDATTRCIDLVNDLGIHKNFIFTGFITGSAKERLYASADLFVMPSVSEPFGVVALEAIKSGTPVIVSKTSGAAEIIHNSLKVDFWDVDKLADEIHAVLRYGSLHDELLDRQVHDLNDQNWDHQIDVLMKVYELAKQKSSQ